MVGHWVYSLGTGLSYRKSGQWILLNSSRKIDSRTLSLAVICGNWCGRRGVLKALFFSHFTAVNEALPLAPTMLPRATVAPITAAAAAGWVWPPAQAEALRWTPQDGRRVSPHPWRPTLMKTSSSTHRAGQQSTSRNRYFTRWWWYWLTPHHGCISISSECLYVVPSHLSHWFEWWDHSAAWWFSHEVFSSFHLGSHKTHFSNKCKCGQHESDCDRHSQWSNIYSIWLRARLT